MIWVRLGATTYLRHDFGSFPPSDHWAQVDVYYPSHGFGCSGFNTGFGSVGYALRLAAWNGLGASSNCSPTPCWRWSSINSHQAVTGPAPNTIYTVGYHVHGGTFDWYVDGVLVLSEALSGVSAFNYLMLNYSAPLCCCESAYFTNVKVGTSQGGSDLFSDDFSAGLDNWYRQSSFFNVPLLAQLVAAPADNPCPTVSVNKTQAMPGDTIHLTGSGFTPGSPLIVYWGGTVGGILPVEVSETADGSGDFSFDMTVPQGVGNGSNGNFPISSPIYVIDGDFLLGCATKFYVCGGGAAADGIMAGWNNPTDQNPTNLPDPIVALLGADDPTSNSNPVLDYIFHEGNHWVLWADPSAVHNAGVFPPPTNHSLNATCISPDGSSVVDYPLDTPYRWSFGGDTESSDPGLFDHKTCGDGNDVTAPVWDGYWCFNSWSKPIYQAQFASDGTTLWVGVLTSQTIPFPWLDNQDAHGSNPGAASQFIPLDVLTSGFTVFSTSGGSSGAPGYHRYISNTVGPLDIYAARSYPTTDAGEVDSGYWSQPCVCMFSFTGGGFTEIGRIAAKYCPGSSRGPGRARGAGNLIGGIEVAQGSYRGDLCSRIAIAASGNDPGVCHVVWSEGGDHGRSGEAASDCSVLRWDGGPATRSYRVNYTTWNPSAKATDQDLWETHIDRDNWNFVWSFDSYPTEFVSGFTWPSPDLMGDAGQLIFKLRNDNASGQVLLFLAPITWVNDPQIMPYPSPDGSGYTWDDFTPEYCDTLQIYDIGGGSPILLHEITPDLFPNELEADTAYPLSGASNQPDATEPVRASDCLYAVLSFANEDTFLSNIPSQGPQDPAFGISDIYKDPLLGGQPVYLVQVPWARRHSYTDQGFIGWGQYPMRGFYRIPADMSAGFDFLDGDRQFDFTIIGGTTGFITPAVFASGDFFSDPNNIWMPSAALQGSVQFGAEGLWFDRVCSNQWKQVRNAETPSGFESNLPLRVGQAACHGHHYNPESDSFSVCAPVWTIPGSPPNLAGVTELFICRGCRSCQCGVGVHIAHRF